MIVPAGKFKAECLKLMDYVCDTHDEVVITKRGKPSARLVAPVDPEEPKLFGLLSGTVTITGDIVGPSGEQWDADI